MVWAYIEIILWLTLLLRHSYVVEDFGSIRAKIQKLHRNEGIKKAEHCGCRNVAQLTREYRYTMHDELCDGRCYKIKPQAPTRL
jgi:hypothetical protein